MRKTLLNLSMILLLSSTCVFSISCGQDKEEEYIPPETKELVPHKQKSKPASPIKSKPAPTPPTIPIGERIDNAIKEAQDTYKKIGEFRDFIFEHALKQSKWIISLSYRIKRLRSENIFGSTLQEIFQNQDFVILKYYKRWGGLLPDQDYYIYEYWGIEIPLSKNYSNDFVLSFTDRYYYENNGYDRGAPKFKLHIWGHLSGYDSSLDNPIPNNPETKKFEERSFAGQIIHSLRTLRMCREQLPLIEQEASKAFIFETTLKKMKMDLEYYAKRQTTSAEKKVQEYKEFQNRIVKLIGDFRERLTIKAEIKDEELDEVIEVF